jgi:hypothetical protein
MAFTLPPMVEMTEVEKDKLNMVVTLQGMAPYC